MDVSENNFFSDVGASVAGIGGGVCFTELF